MQAEVASELGRLRASVGGLEDTRADLTKQIASKTSTACLSPIANLL